MPILTQSARTSHWPVEGETSPGIWFRLQGAAGAPDIESLLQSLVITVDHGQRRQTITGAAFLPLTDAVSLYQTRYLYAPEDGVLFVTLSLASRAMPYFPDTQRIELDNDCWHLVTYRVRGPLSDDGFWPPPYPRTVYLTASLSSDPQLYLDVFVSRNCFRNPLPPH